jgi:MFS family permease
VFGLLLYPLAPTLWTLVMVIPLVPIGTALLFPSTTSLMSRASDKSEVGTTMGTAQFFAGISRVAAPVGATLAFQTWGHGSPFYLGAALVALVSLLAFRIEHQSVQPTPVPVGKS